MIGISRSAKAGHTVGAPARLMVEDVTVRFAGLTALGHVSFMVEPGTVHAIIGPNGAGSRPASTC